MKAVLSIFFFITISICAFSQDTIPAGAISVRPYLYKFDNEAYLRVDSGSYIKLAKKSDLYDSFRVVSDTLQGRKNKVWISITSLATSALDSLRLQGSVIQGRKNGNWINQLNIPSSGGGTDTTSLSSRIDVLSVEVDSLANKIPEPIVGQVNGSDSLTLPSGRLYTWLHLSGYGPLNIGTTLNGDQWFSADSIDGTDDYVTQLGRVVKSGLKIYLSGNASYAFHWLNSNLSTPAVIPVGFNTYTVAASAGQSSFTLPDPTNDNKTDAWRNGVYIPFSVSGSNITTTAFDLNDILFAKYIITSPATYSRQSIAATAGQTVFTTSITLPADASKIDVFRNGILIPFTNTTNSVTISAADLNDVVLIKVVNTLSTVSKQSFSATSGQTTFTTSSTLPVDEKKIDVYRNGVKIGFTHTGSQFTIGASDAGDNISIKYF